MSFLLTEYHWHIWLWIGLFLFCLLKLNLRLPREIYQFLRHVGDLADELNVQVFVVGGFVRDLILGKPNDDIDLVVEENGIAFADALAQVS
jgi:tRNA nucleotidyltransferase (CCA-adding enzyme)